MNEWMNERQNPNTQQLTLTDKFCDLILEIEWKDKSIELINANALLIHVY